MLNRKTADIFYKSLDGLKEKMSNVSHDIQTKKECINRSLDDMIQNINTLKILDDEVEKNNKEMFDNCFAIFEDIENATSQWKTNFEKILAQENFRNEFKDSFLVIIYGKVKAGKSSFGNFIAENCLNTQSSKYFKYDEAGENRKEIAELEELDDDTFDVKNTEATIEIQGFRLSGLTWIDTPGLASMTAVNGVLAKEYIESADLVVYPVSSDAPGRTTDTKEILELFDKNKTVNVIITKSDKTTKKVIDGKIVKVLDNKTHENREKQEKYVLNEIKNMLPSEKQHLLGEIYSISIHAAKQALKIDDSELYNASQLDLFFEQMSKVIKSDALKLKTEAPNNRLKSFVDLQIIGNGTNQNGSLEQIRSALEKIEKKRVNVLDDLKEKGNNLKGELTLTIEYEVDKIFYELNEYNVEKILQKILMNIQIKFKKELEVLIGSALDGFNDSILDLNLQLDSNEFQIKDRTEKFQYSDTNRKRNIGKVVAVLGGGLLTAWAIANFWNPTGWAAGAAALAIETATLTGAGYLGGKAGEMFGEDNEEEVVVGDNKSEIISKLKVSVQNLIEKQLSTVIEKLDTFYFKPIAEFSDGITRIIDELESNLKRCVDD